MIVELDEYYPRMISFFDVLQSIHYYLYQVCNPQINYENHLSLLNGRFINDVTQLGEGSRTLLGTMYEGLKNTFILG